MDDIFISYSRLDATFVEQLSAALKSQGRTVWLDTSSIAPTSVWRQDIIEAINAASAVLFVISPNWLASETCQRELQYAIEVHKKLVPVMYLEVDSRQVNPTLANINWVMARPGDNPQTALRNILFAVDTDIQYWRQGSDLLTRARQWDESKRQPAYTLRGEALRQAEQWLAESPKKIPPPHPLQIEYITSSRHAAAARQRTIIAALSAGIIVTLILSLVTSVLAVANQHENAQLRARNLQLAGEAIANEARAQYGGDKADLAVLLAAAAYKVGQPGDSLTRKALFSVIHQEPHLNNFLVGPSTASFFDAASYIGYSSDGNTQALVRQSVVTIQFASKPQVNFTPPAPSGQVSPNILGGALSSDGRLVAIKIQDNSGSHITLWSATTGKQMGQLDGLTYEGQAQQHDMAFSPDGRFLASEICPDAACNTTQLTIWNVKTSHIVAQIPGLYSLGAFFGASVSFSRDSRYVAFSDTKNNNIFTTASRVVVFDLQLGAVSYILNSPTQVTALAFSPSPQILAVARVAGTQGQVDQVAFWNVVTQTQVGQVTSTYDFNPIDTIEFSSNLYWMLTADTLHTVNLWGVDSTFATDALNEDVTSVHSSLTAVGLSPDGNQVTTSSEDGQITVWRLSPFTSSSPSADLTYGNDASLAFSSDNRQLLYSNDNFGTINSWNVVDGTPGASITNLPDSLTQLLAVSRDGSQLAAAESIGSSTSSKLVIFDPATGNVEGSPWTSPLFNFSSLEFSPDGRSLLACGSTYAGLDLCFLWNAQSHALIQSFGQPSSGQSQDQQFVSGSFSPDGASIGFALIVPAPGSSNGTTSEIGVYSTAAQRVTAKVDIGPELPLAVSWSPNSRYVGSLDTKGNVKIWKSTAGAQPIEVTKVPSGIQSTLKFMAPPTGADPTSQWIMVASEASLEVWQIDSKGQPSQYLDPLFFPSPIFSAASSPSGKYLAVGENTTGLISVLSLDPSDWIKQACSIAGRNLTLREWQTYVQATSGVPYERLCPEFPVLP